MAGDGRRPTAATSRRSRPGRCMGSLRSSACPRSGARRRRRRPPTCRSSRGSTTGNSTTALARCLTSRPDGRAADLRSGLSRLDAAPAFWATNGSPRSMTGIDRLQGRANEALRGDIAVRCSPVRQRARVQPAASASARFEDRSLRRPPSASRPAPSACRSDAAARALFATPPEQACIMDIHKPKAWHGVREFLKEYMIIVVGVLTALGAEQGGRVPCTPSVRMRRRRPTDVGRATTWGG